MPPVVRLKPGPDDGPPFRYGAFISYASATAEGKDRTALDREVARRLIQLLETYRTPKRLLAAGSGVLPRLQKVFRDREELHATPDLGTTIREALKLSRWLIVICSRQTPRSRWVREEVDYFLELGREDYILMVLVDGEPAEAFPEKLLGGARVPLAADVRDLTQGSLHARLRQGALKLLAPMLGCSLDDLRQRERERRLRRQAWLAGGVAAGSVAAAVLLFYSYLAQRRAAQNLRRAVEASVRVFSLTAASDMQGISPPEAAQKAAYLTATRELLRDVLTQEPGNPRITDALRAVETALIFAEKRANVKFDAEEAWRNARGRLLPSVCNRLNAWKPSNAPPKLAPEELIFPNDAETARVRALLAQGSQLTNPRIDDAVSFADTASEILPKLNLFDREQLVQAREVVDRAIALCAAPGLPPLEKPQAELLELLQRKSRELAALP